MALKRAVAILVTSATLIVGEVSLGQAVPRGIAVEDMRVVLGALASLSLAVNLVTMAGASSMTSRKDLDGTWAEAGLVVAGVTAALGAGNIAAFGHHQMYNEESLAIGVSALVASAIGFGVGIVYFVSREKFPKEEACAMPTSLTDRGGNLVPGVALQVVGF